MAEQLSFALPSKAALEREDFYVSPANAIAVAMLEDPALWPNRKLILIGPQGAGKTHLAHVWAAQTGAHIHPASSLSSLAIDESAQQPLVIEDADQINEDADTQVALFHLHNLMLERGQPLLVTAQSGPRDWALTLPDLASRMQGTSTVSIDLPDEDLLGAVLLKLFNDRQLSPTSSTITYLARNMERSFAQAGALVDALDTEALRSGRKINRGLAIDILDKILSDRA